MALTGTDRGTGSHNTTATTLAVVPASNLAAGSMAVLVVAADNTGASGAYSITTATDTKNNTWTRQQSPLYDPGAAEAGVQGAIFTTPQNGGALTTSDTITVTFSVTTVAKAWTLTEVVPAAGFAVGYIAGGVNAGAASAAPTVTTGSITNGDMVIGGLFNEYGTAQVVTGDADTTNGSWSAQQTIDVGLTTSGMGVSSQYKVVTATATQTYNPTLLTSSDVILAWVRLFERSLPGTACYHVEVRADTPTAYWRLGEGSGNPQDSVGTNHVTVVGGTPDYSQAGALSGDTNTAIQLVAASTEYFSVPDATALDVGNGPVTFEFWAKRAAAGIWAQVLDKDSIGQCYGVYFYTDNLLHAELHGTGDWVASASADTDTTAFHHWVVTKDGNTNSHIYRDAIEVTGTTTNRTIDDGTPALFIGAYNEAGVPTAGSYFDGSLDEIAIYKSVLSPSRVAAHYDARAIRCRVPRSTPYPQLLGH